MFEQFKLQKQQDLILNNLDSAIITLDDSNISYFNSMGKDLVTELSVFEDQNIHD